MWEQGLQPWMNSGSTRVIIKETQYETGNDWNVAGQWKKRHRRFEEVVKLDLEYIDNWSIGLDFKILFKTIAVVFHHGGAK